MRRHTFRSHLLTASMMTVVGAALLAGQANAQHNAILTGHITADSAGVPIPRAGVRLPEVERFAHVDAAGAFRIDQLAAGTYVVIAEAPGFRAQRMVVTLGVGESKAQNFALTRSAQLLATVDVRAKAPPRVSPKMVDFERRRQRGYGRYVTRAELERVPGRQLEEVLRALGAAARFVKSPSGQTWLISSRQDAAHHGFSSSNSDNLRDAVCPVQVVLDGMVISSSEAPRAPRIRAGSSERAGVSDPRTQVQGGDDPVDINLFMSDQLEGVEFYADATMTPLEYRTPAAVCGTLLLWTRDK
jgi:hypothetical protein